MHHLSVIIPAYNEEKRIGKTLEAILKYLNTQNYTWEVLIVDDASTDNTRKVVSDQIKRFSNPSLSPQQADGVLRSASRQESLIAKSDDVAEPQGIR